MPELETVNAKIDYTMLGIEAHGIMTFSIGLQWNGGCQSFGGYTMDGYGGKDKDRTGYAPSIIAIRKILETVGVSKWEDLKGKLVRAKIGTIGTSKQPIIGHIMDDRWFDLEAFMKEQEEPS